MKQLNLRGTAAWTLLVLLVGVIYWAVSVDDLQAIEEAKYSYVRKLALLERLESLPEEEDAIKERLETLNAEAMARFLYTGDDNTVRSFIQRDLRNLAASTGINLKSMRTLGGARQVGDLASSAVQVNIVATHAELVGFLQGLEREEPLLKARRLSVRVRQASTDTTAAELAVTLEVAGFRRVE